MPSKTSPRGAVLEREPNLIRKSTNLAAGSNLRTRSPKSSTGVGTPAANRNTTMSTTAAKLAARPATSAAKAEMNKCLLPTGADEGVDASSFLLRYLCLLSCMINPPRNMNKKIDNTNDGSHTQDEYHRVIDKPIIERPIGRSIKEVTEYRCTAKVPDCYDCQICTHGCLPQQQWNPYQ